jgi:hypothetical protein
MAAHKQWIVTLSGDRPAAEVRQALSEHGFEVDQALEEIGVLTGRSDDATADKARGVSGVADVAADSSIDIGPPDADPTW